MIWNMGLCQWDTVVDFWMMITLHEKARMLLLSAKIDRKLASEKKIVSEQ